MGNSPTKTLTEQLIDFILLYQSYQNKPEYDSLKSTATKQQMTAVCNELSEKVQLLYDPDPHVFVVRMLRLLKDKTVTYKYGQWDLFMPFVSNEDFGCNCMCGTLFVLICCEAMGFFPGEISVIHYPCHVLISSKYQQAIETTEQTAHWRSHDVYKQQKGLDAFVFLSTVDEVMDLVKIDAMGYLRNQSDQLKILETLSRRDGINALVGYAYHAPTKAERLKAVEQSVDEIEQKGLPLSYNEQLRRYAWYLNGFGDAPEVTALMQRIVTLLRVVNHRYDSPMTRASLRSAEGVFVMRSRLKQLKSDF